jgi:quercetin dioxygenase-like cupin family protein
MSFSTRTSEVGVIAGPEHGLRGLIVRVQAVAADDIGHLHRHDNADQILCALEGEVLVEIEGEVLVEIDGEAKVCRAGELGIVPAGTAHGFLGLGAPALLEVFGSSSLAPSSSSPAGREVELHRPGVPWDRPGPATDMSTLAPRLLAPRRR